MGGWIKFWKDMPNDPRVLAAAALLADRYILAQRTNEGTGDLRKSEALALCRNAVTGAVVTLWCYADEHIRDDDSLPLTSQTLDAVVGLEGFFSVMPREWIDELDDGRVVLPGYCEKNSLIAKRKRTIKSNARVTRWRHAKKLNSNGVTNNHETQCNAAGDLDQDRDQDQDKKKNQNLLAAAPPTRRTVPRVAITDEQFLEFKLAYPERSGDYRWKQARSGISARLSEGSSLDEIMAGARRYAAYCAATGKSATEYVMQASRFCGTEKPFLLPWQAPPKAETATEQMLRNLDGSDDSQVIEHEPERRVLPITRQ